MKNKRKRIKQSIGVGLSIGIVYAIVGAVISAVAGVDAEIAGIYIALYVVGGVLGGALVGCFLSLAYRNRGGAFVVGVLGALPFFMLLGITLSLAEQDVPLEAGLVSAVVTALLLGGPLGVHYLYHPEK